VLHGSEMSFYANSCCQFDVPREFFMVRFEILTAVKNVHIGALCCDSMFTYGRVPTFLSDILPQPSVTMEAVCSIERRGRV
jgi:hypothetical protein